MSVNDLDVLNIAGYKFEPLDDVEVLVPEFQSVCDDLELKGSVYLSPNGINFSLAGNEESIEQYLHFMEQDERFLDVPLKKTYSETQPFRRMKENKDDVIVLDTRNEYETRGGLFENALDLQLDTFRDFPKAIEQLPDEYKDKQIVMYCTGGIRCEKASAVMIKAGFSDVRQLEGGVLDYFKETGGAYWNGDCFVFDERVALDKELNETEYVYCYICREPLSAEEKASNNFKINEFCPYCIISNR